MSMSTSRLTGSLAFLSWILVLLFSSQCWWGSTSSTEKAAEIFEESAKAFEEFGRKLQQWVDVASVKQNVLEEGYVSEKKEALFEGPAVSILTIGLERTAKALAKAERAAREKTVKAAKSQALEEAKTFEKVSAALDAIVVAIERCAKVLRLRKSAAREVGIEEVLLQVAFGRALMLGAGVSAEGTMGEAFVEASLAIESLCLLVLKNGVNANDTSPEYQKKYERSLKEVLESPKHAAIMFKKAAEEAISGTE